MYKTVCYANTYLQNALVLHAYLYGDIVFIGRENFLMSRGNSMAIQHVGEAVLGFYYPMRMRESIAYASGYTQAMSIVGI